MSAHTPGPWIAEYFSHLGWTVRTFEEGMAADFICEHVASPSDVSADNARLIAAAPELLAACELMLALNDNPEARVLGYFHASQGARGPLLDPKAAAQLRAALVKARGA